MKKVISVFNNKGGVGKTTVTWNLGDSVASLGKKVLIIDFDPQCNLSIAMLGEDIFRDYLPNQNSPYGLCIRAYLQRFLQNTSGEEVFLHKSAKSHENLHIIAGDFWLNVYGEQLSVGSDLLTGSGISKFIVLHRLIKSAEDKIGYEFDFVFLDLPPSFGALVRAALYSSDYFLVPCTSDNFSAYCVGLIGQMLPKFVEEWNDGLKRFKETNPHFTDYDKLGHPIFGGWIFNGFDTAKKRNSLSDTKEMILADKTHFGRIKLAIQTDLIQVLRNKKDILTYDAVAVDVENGDAIGDIEDMNVLIQNSLWQNVPVSKLNTVKQITDLQARNAWAANQLDQIQRLGIKFDELAKKTIQICV